jgi:hypothetical protein|tara:strand:- start:3411 stop:3527 length:117 start_codon:yes stop_codon:yes gene_type:complete
MDVATINEMTIAAITNIGANIAISVDEWKRRATVAVMM